MGRRIQITESQLRYIIENINRVDEQSSAAEIAAKRQQQFSSDAEKAEYGDKNTGTIDDKGKALALAGQEGYTVVFQQYKSDKPEKIELPELRGNFYANYTSLDLGLMPNGLEQLKEDINNLKTYLTNNGYDLKNTTVTLYGSASKESATNRHELDQHPKHDFGGKLPQSGWVKSGPGVTPIAVKGGNEFLAKSRANNIAKLMQQMIPGIKTEIAHEVENCAGAECRRLKATVSGSKTTKDTVSKVRLALKLQDGNGYWTTNEWNARHTSENCTDDVYCSNQFQCQIKNPSDKRENGQVVSHGVRGITVGVNATGGGIGYEQQVSYKWWGDNGFIPVKPVYRGQRDSEGKKVVTEGLCTKIPGLPNITGDYHKGNAQYVKNLLRTSAHFTSEGVDAIMSYLKRATPNNLKAIDPKNPFDLMRKDKVVLKGVSEENFQTFLKYCQKAGITVNPNPTQKQLIAAGAIIITPENKVISNTI